MPLGHTGRTLCGMARHAVTAGSVGRGSGRRPLIVGSIAFVVVAVVVLVVVLSGSKSATSPPAPVSVGGVQQVAALLHGIPQHGSTLGSPKAPVTLVEFADPQCPYCGAWARDSLPTIVSHYVRTGKVLLVFEGMTFVRPDSTAAFRTALAAGLQNRFWNVLELLYENQGQENAGWVTDSLLQSIGDAVPGLDTARMLADRSSAAVDSQVKQADAAASKLGVNSTPSFGVGRTGGTVHLVQVTSLSPSALTPALDAAAKR